MNLQEKDKKYIWHPFTQMKTAPLNIPIVKGEGVYIYTENGTKILDAVSSWWTNIHGHSHPYIAEAVCEQFNTLEHVIFAGFTHPKAIELSERIIGKLPYLNKVFFSDNGSTAVEVAIKMAFQYWYNKKETKTKIIAFNHAYHGDTFGAMSVGGRDTFNNPFNPFLFDVEFIDVPTPGNENIVIQQLNEKVKNNDVAAFIFEPLVQGSAGMVMYASEILNELIVICKQHEVLCIADEVMTGFGRTGKFFATDYIENKPDIVSLSKGLTGGTMPLGLTVCSDKIYNEFLSDDHSKTFFHGHSFTGHPLACAASCASMDLMEKPETWQQIEMIIAEHQQFGKKLESYSLIKNVTQRGTIIAIEFDTGTNTSYFNNLRDVLYNYFLEKNILLRPLGNILYILPPYCITKDELNTIYDAIEEFLINY
ncbi:adenosylmethionine--8-amino-7-oxononanoate transaminase [Vicingus serpentipes]|uniref:Adenosylmethionine-8-amino-7-oxononanoate aminotransferase n=1 Tax=Vicingus serpentipes TaxID=1926625 RepID=A0A5C6RTN7_9FLAO|nr:adenosylmethionine--8-amino-7-oxononanoate transaminase [Vicingus serpentipes]TXB65369.1 adenosylmethionine--8-amino-7-oxononanoate transaminase [Vicingus serpentipes]